MRDERSERLVHGAHLFLEVEVPHQILSKINIVGIIFCSLELVDKVSLNNAPAFIELISIVDIKSSVKVCWAVHLNSCISSHDCICNSPIHVYI